MVPQVVFIHGLQPGNRFGFKKVESKTARKKQAKKKEEIGDRRTGQCPRLVRRLESGEQREGEEAVATKDAVGVEEVAAEVVVVLLLVPTAATVATVRRLAAAAADHFPRTTYAATKAAVELAEVVEVVAAEAQVEAQGVEAPLETATAATATTTARTTTTATLQRLALLVVERLEVGLLV